MAASFDTALLLEVADAISDEIRAKNNEYAKQGKTDIYQGLTMCSPNINIFRDPHGAGDMRPMAKTPSTGKMAPLLCPGTAGRGAYHQGRRQSQALRRPQRSGKKSATADASIAKKDLYGNLSPGLSLCDRAHPASRRHGCLQRGQRRALLPVPTSASKNSPGRIRLSGYVESDAWAISDIAAFHHKAADLAEAAANSLNAGCDLNLGIAYPHLGEAVERGLVTEETVTRAAERLFLSRFRLGCSRRTAPTIGFPMRRWTVQPTSSSTSKWLGRRWCC